ncbi:hypothetical protein ACWEOZ_12900 [Actinoplanes sp. NPDC004185]
MSDGTFLPSGVTPWSAYNTPRIWAMVANEDDPESWRQVAALGSMAGLVKDQRSRLELAKQKLIEAWPPEKNKASAAFVELIDNLLFTMQRNKDVADANAGALGRILEALRQAKKDVEPLFQQYLEKSDDWLPGWWDNAEDELDEQARARMREAETVIAHPDNAITSPGLYEFAPGAFVSRPIGGAEGGRPVTTSGESGISAATGFEVPHDPPPASPDAGTSAPAGGTSAVPLPPGSASGGPDLAGVVSPVPASPPPITPVALPAPAGSSAGLPVPGLVIGGGPPAGLPSSGVRGGRGSAGPFGALPPRGTSGGPGGRGSRPVGKPVPPSWLPPASGLPPRVRSGASAQPGRPSAVPPAGGKRRFHQDREDGMTFDPDSRWVAAEGVAPVIEPSRRRDRHDPGPGVIGWRG